MPKFSDLIVQYYQQLSPPAMLPGDVEVMNPYKDDKAMDTTRLFYQKFYNDEEKRYICFGINPGRFGGGITGIPFTDPINLEEKCGIKNTFQKKPELSSRFIYEMIEAYGSPATFYKKYFISAVSPLGYMKDSINLNYYDIKGYRNIFEEYVVREIKKQLELPIYTSVAFSIGKGQNIKYLSEINKKHGFFDKIVPLSHPRWVMQYRLKRKDEFINEYLSAFNENR